MTNWNGETPTSEKFARRSSSQLSSRTRNRNIPLYSTASKHLDYFLGEPGAFSHERCYVSYLLWIGDFNYRLSDPDNEVRACIESKDYVKAMKSDQLTSQRLARKAFGGFEEAPVLFHPSYKYDPGTDTFDTSEKRRAPAWCDRILWRSGDRLENLLYTSHIDLKTSDHKPVSAVFLATKVKIFSLEKMNEIQMEIVRELDKFENESMPGKITLLLFFFRHFSLAHISPLCL